MTIQGSVALVTGANRGIGRALVEELLARGVRRVYAAARDEESVGGDDPRIVAIRLDVTDPAEIRAAANRAQDVDLLVNNAGVVSRVGGPLTDSAWLEAGRNEMQVNVFGALQVTQAFAPVLAANGGGTIVNINSVASFVGFPVIASYSMSKAALHSLTQLTRSMLAAQKTKVIGVYPGPVDPEMTSELPIEKTSPAIVARLILDGLENGDEDVFPDPASQSMGKLFLADPKALERQIAQQV